jgi:glycine cleavage system H lipoate-binding protein
LISSGAGWILRLQPTVALAGAELLDAQAYAAIVAAG